MGPLSVKMGRNQAKRYTCVFTCMATSAVHIEMAYSLETHSFLTRSKGFVAAMVDSPLCLVITAQILLGKRKDCVTVWINEINLRHIIRCVNRILNGNSHLLVLVIRVGFERVVRFVRKIMRSLAGERWLDDDTLCTLLAEITRILNNRALRPISDDVHDLMTLTQGWGTCGPHKF